MPTEKRRNDATLEATRPSGEKRSISAIHEPFDSFEVGLLTGLVLLGLDTSAPTTQRLLGKLMAQATDAGVKMADAS